MLNEIKYQATWGKLYILLGFLFGLLFILGAVILRDYTICFNLLGSFIVIYIGFEMLRRPYIQYSDKEIKVMGFWGNIRKHYHFESTKAIRHDKNRFYQNGQKLQFNSWMVDKKDWERMVYFFEDDGDAIMSELVE